MSDVLLTVSQVAKRTDRSRATVHGWIEKKILPVQKIGSEYNGIYVIKESDLEEFLKLDRGVGKKITRKELRYRESMANEDGQQEQPDRT